MNADHYILTKQAVKDRAETVIHAPATEPLMIIRFRGPQHLDADVLKRTLAMLGRYRKSCDEVWFSTGIGMPPLSRHRELSAILADAAEELRVIGIIPSLQIQGTLGHADRISALADMSGKTWGGFTGDDGTETEFCNCPRQPEFLKYCSEMAAIYAAWKPGSVWIDDDLRMNGHSPVATGCYCPTCIAQFSQEEGCSYTRESLVAALKDDVELVSRWNDFRAKSIEQVAEVITKAVHKISPDTRMGLQHSETWGRDRIFKVMAKESGHSVGSRPGGGVYTDHNPRDLIRKALQMSVQIGRQPGYELVDRICPEIESCPRCFSCKTAHGLVVESLLDLAMGMNCLSYFIMDAELETPEWYGNALMSRLNDNAERFRNYVRFNKGTMPGGIGGDSYVSVACLGLPLCAGSPFLCGRLLSEDSARSLSDAQIRHYLSGGVIMDAPVVTILQERGFSDEMGGLFSEKAELGLRERFTDDSLNEGMVDARHSTYSGRCYRLKALSTTMRVIGRYYQNRNGKDAGIASVLVETPSGGRIAAFGCGELDSSMASSNRVRQMLRAADWIAGGTLPVIPESPIQCMIIPRITKDGELRSVAVLNTVIDRQAPFTLCLRGCPESIRTVRWIAIGENPLDITLRRDGQDTIVSLPEIAAWNMGWLRLGNGAE